MKRTVTYTVVITRHPRYYVAKCPALPSWVTFHKSRAKAYAALKTQIREHVGSRLIGDQPLPSDPVVSVKHLRLNLDEIREEGRLAVIGGWPKGLAFGGQHLELHRSFGRRAL